MYPNVADLRDFYQTPAGRIARRMIRRRMRTMWPNLRDLSVLGVGYATPYLRPFAEQAERVAAVMPAQQGVLRWPAEGGARAALAEEDELPFLDATFDRVVMVHALEASEQLPALLAEVWRILVGNGRLLVIVPNRHGLWARSDRTPFGQGHPYTHAQLARLLHRNRFTPNQSGEALFCPPQAPRGWVRSGEAWEKIGARWFPRFAGVIMIESVKQVYAAAPRRRRALTPVRALLPTGGVASRQRMAPCASAPSPLTSPSTSPPDRARETARDNGST